MIGYCLSFATGWCSQLVPLPSNRPSDPPTAVDGARRRPYRMDGDGRRTVAEMRRRRCRAAAVAV